MIKRITNTSVEEFHPEWTMGGNPGAIEAQEKRGQKELAESSQLPVKLNSPICDGCEKIKGKDFGWDAKKDYGKMGIKVLKRCECVRDELFYEVQLPKGWKIVSTDHSMWSRLVDEKGRERLSIFYKAAFYDRDAFVNINRRFKVETSRYDKVDGEWETTPEFKTKQDIFAKVLDGDKVVFKTEVRKVNIKHVGLFETLFDKCQEEAENWLNRNYPNYKDVHAYWVS